MSDNQIVLITDPDVLAIPIVESGECVVNLKEIGGLHYRDTPPETPESAPYYTILRKSIYDKILLAQKLLPKGLRFRVYEGYRSPYVQQKLFENILSGNEKAFPNLNCEKVFYKTTELVSPVINFDGSKNIPAHSTGAAVDIEIVDGNGKAIDMGMEVKDWSSVPPEICYMDCNIISNEAKRNRKILFNVLTKSGFVNYPTEWWHWSYGDRYWAYHKQCPNAIYGMLEL